METISNLYKDMISTTYRAIPIHPDSRRKRNVYPESWEGGTLVYCDKGRDLETGDKYGPVFYSFGGYGSKIHNKLYTFCLGNNTQNLCISDF